jgi:hypothetical protein
MIESPPKKKKKGFASLAQFIYELLLTSCVAAARLRTVGHRAIHRS